MSLISADVPTLHVGANDLQHLVRFIYKHELLLKQFGAIKLELNADCQLALKKRRKNMTVQSIAQRIVKLTDDEPIYSIDKLGSTEDFFQKSSIVTSESSFWSSLSSLKSGTRKVQTSRLPNKSFFSQKKSRMFFNIYRLPGQSLLKLGGSKVTRQFLPCVKRAHGSGAVFPLMSAQQNLFSIDYHHEGGAHHWYVIPTQEREALKKLISIYNSSMCPDHGQLLIDPSVLDKHHIRYHRIVQRPNEFVVLSAGTIAQSFAEDVSWSESISFALPSWIDEIHASTFNSLCQCNIFNHSSFARIDINLFRHEIIQRYIKSYLNVVKEDTSTIRKGLLYAEAYLLLIPYIFIAYKTIHTGTMPTPNSVHTDSSNGMCPSTNLTWLIRIIC